MSSPRSPTLRLMLLALLVGFLALVAAAEEHDHDHDHDHAAAHDETSHAEEVHDEEDHSGHSHGISEADYSAALASGEDPCALEALSDYDLGLHIGSVFILLGVSMAGSLAPVALRAASTGPKVSTAIRLGTYFGYGTILSTAFIHMLLPAVENLGNPCLATFWKESYEAWPYLFVTAAVLLMQLVDFLIRGYFRRRGDAHAAGGHGCHNPSALIGAIMSTDGAAAHQQAHNQRKDVEGGEANEDGGTCPVHGEGCNTLLKHQPDAAQTVGIYMTEAGIIFHSVMIGLTLGVSDGSAFTTLLAALSFHQFFEGFAIGSAAVDAGLGAVKCGIMSIAYSITTPIGIAIGIGVRESFNQNATSTLLATGILDALSTGVLLYVVLVQLITPTLTDSDWLHSRRWPMQLLAYAAFYSGAACMAVIGKWA